MPVPLIRTSERGDFKECPWKWYHSWVLGLSTRRVPTWSWFGTAWHKALEVRYPVGHKRVHIADVIDAFVEAVGEEQRRVWTAGGELDEEEVVDGKELGIAMLKAYVEHYGTDRHWQVIHTEQPFQIDVPHPVTGKLIAVYCGTWDLLVWDLVDKVYRLVDHKTRKAFKQDWSFYDLNDQGGSYLWVAREVLLHKGLIKKRDVIDGIVFNMARKTMPDERPRDAQGIAYNKPRKEHYLAALTRAGKALDPKVARTVKLADLEASATLYGLTVLGEPSLKQPTPAFARYTTYRTDYERVNQGRKVVDEARHMNVVRRGKLPLLKHVTEDCSRCQFFDMCLLDEKDPQEAQAYAATMLVRRDPYADHREAMARSGVAL